MAVHFSYENHADGASLTASSQEAAMPAANVQDPRPTVVWRATGCSSEQIVFDLGAAKNLSVVALLGFNLTSGAQLSLQANSSDSWTSPPFDESLDYHADIIIQYFQQASYRYWRLLLADSGNPDGYIQAGRVWLGSLFEPARDISSDFSLRRVDPSSVVYSDSGSRIVACRTPYRLLQLRLPSTNEKPDFDALLGAVGKSGDFIVSLDPTNSVWQDGLHNYTVYCHLADDPEWIHRVGDRWSLRLTLRETI